MKIARLTLLSLSALLLAACHGHRQDPATSPTDPGAGIDSTTASEAGDAGAVGTWGDRDAPHTPFLELMEDGGLAGSDGCNRLIGSWAPQENHLAITLTGSTLMACEDVETWLRDGRTARIEEDTLIVMDDGGAEIGRLSKRR